MSESIVGPGEFYQVVGVGPHSKPWPTDNHFDQALLEHGDRRNVPPYTKLTKTDLQPNKKKSHKIQS